MKEDFSFKKELKLEDRRKESDRILNQYTNRMPIICECAPNNNLPPIQKTKYLVPGDMTVGQFQFLIRKHIDLNKEEALFLIVHKGKDDIAIAGDKTMREIYNNFRDREDNFLYIHYTSEQTWG